MKFKVIAACLSLVLLTSCTNDTVKGQPSPEQPPTRFDVTSVGHTSVTDFYLIKDNETGEEYLMAEASYNGGRAIIKLEHKEKK